MKETVAWESQGKNEAGVPFFSVMENDGYYFGRRGGTDSVAFILFDREHQAAAVINERKPPLDGRFGEDAFLQTAFGGSIDKSHSIEQIVIEEVKEEAGFTVTSKDVHHLGRVLVSTQMDQFCELFIVFVDIGNDGDKEPQNEMEAMATVDWMDYGEIFDLEDWKATTILTKASRKGLI